MDKAVRNKIIINGLHDLTSATSNRFYSNNEHFNICLSELFSGFKISDRQDFI